MRNPRHFAASIVAVMSAVLCFALPAHAFDHSHADFDRVLKQHVSDGWVDYAALKADRAPLESYLAQLAAVPETEFNGWAESDRLAFLINLYNAATLKLIVDHYPLKSIKNIGSLLSGPWSQEVVHLFGQVITLDTVEHEIVRKKYRDARVHFALVCAARGCPPLRTEAFVGARLAEQLDEQGRRFLGETQKNRVDARSRTIYLSPIFKWFSEDFERQSGSVLTFVTPFLPEEGQRALASGTFKIRHTEYDWSLNDRSRK